MVVSYRRFGTTHSSAKQFKIKVKCTLVQALRLCTGRTAHRESRGIALLFHDQRHKKWVRGQHHAPGALYPRGKTRYPLYRRLGGPQGRSGQVRKISPPPGFDPPDRPARSSVAIPTALHRPTTSSLNCVKFQKFSDLIHAAAEARNKT